MEFTGGKKYGLHLRVPVGSQSKKPVKKPVDLSSVFRVDEEDTAEDELARQASKKRSLREVEELHKRALEEDPSVFDYDGVYENMKEKESRPIREDRAERQSKYIGKLVEKAKVRAQEQDIVRERLLVKERMQEDHLYKDKEKFVTSAYKKKLAEQAKWQEEERLRELQDKAEEVTNRSDLSDFYRNLLAKNVAFGADDRGKDAKVVPDYEPTAQEGPSASASPNTSASVAVTRLDDANEDVDGKDDLKEDQEVQASAEQEAKAEPVHEGKVAADLGSTDQSPSTKAGSSSQRRPSQEAVSSARERFLARKKQRAS